MVLASALCARPAILIAERVAAPGCLSQAAHILACLFYMVPTLFKCDKTILAYGDDFNGAPFAEGDFNGTSRRAPPP